MSETQATHADIMRHDLDPAFLRSLSGEVAWRYRENFRSLRQEALCDDARNEFFNHLRGKSAQLAMVQASEKHGIPWEARRLNGNGQYKIIVKSGRVLLIQEAVRFFDEHPKIADYKLELSEAHSFMRQLELKLGDRPDRTTDWSGCILAVLLHGSYGSAFTETQKDLGIFTIAVPDAGYRQWLLRMDLHGTAMYGDEAEQKNASIDDRRVYDQQDRVVVTRKRKNQIQVSGE